MIAALIVITLMQKVAVKTGRLYQHRGILKTTHKWGTAAVKKKRLIQKLQITGKLCKTRCKIEKRNVQGKQPD